MTTTITTTVMIMLIIIIIIIIMSGLSEINYMCWFYSLTSAQNRTWITKKKKLKIITFIEKNY